MRHIPPLLRSAPGSFRHIEPGRVEFRLRHTGELRTERDARRYQQRRRLALRFPNHDNAQE